MLRPSMVKPQTSSDYTHISYLKPYMLRPQISNAQSSALTPHMLKHTRKVCSRGETFNIASTKLQCDIKETKVQGTKVQGKLENYKPTKICISGCTYPDPKHHVRICIA